jgi:cytochrome c oxidase subunit III
MPSEPTLDVSNLPSSSLDDETPLWWGNVIAMAVETTILSLLLMCYFYVRKNFHLWPPPYVDTLHPVLHPYPKLLLATLNTVLMVASCWPMAQADRLARRFASLSPQSHPPSERARWEREAGDARPGIRRALLRWLILVAVMMAAACALRWFGFRALYFDWNDNAYASVAWSLLVLQLIYLLFSLVEVALVAVWIGGIGLQEKMAEDLTLVAGFWYWTVAAWLVVYAVVYWSPRLMR